MSIIKKMRKQQATWWERSATPDKWGRFTYSAPVQIDCRWDDVGVEFRDPKGQTVMSNSVVFPDRILSIGDMLKEGAVESDEPEDPTTVTAAYEIQRFDKTPNFRATETLFTAYL